MLKGTVGGVLLLAPFCFTNKKPWVTTRVLAAPGFATVLVLIPVEIFGSIALN